MTTNPPRWPPWSVTGAAFLLSILVALLDNLTGSEISFSILYLAPVGIAAWHGSRETGFLLAIWSGVLGLAADLWSGTEYSDGFIAYWNALVLLGFFLIISFLLSRLGRTLDMVHQQAHLDPLTELPNSRRFMEMVEGELKRMKRYRRPLTLAYVDLDNFKVVNDTKGHDEGDRVLREVARVLRANVRETDRVARLGGDEFCALLPETGEDGAYKVLEKVREGILALAKSEGWPVTISLGAATFLEVPASAREAIQRADSIMYQVKRAGKNSMLLEVVGDPPATDPPSDPEA